ncbi:MAG: tyrosine-type recombinase/integrase [Erysipelotrichaceae bacterium]|nr:tyrosine-type recombinase/integrase [Erysipelotrichaceae bacterium]
MELHEALRSYMTEIAINRGMARTSSDSYNSDLQQYLTYLETNGINDVSAINKELIYSFISEQLNNKDKSSVARMISSIRSFHAYLSASTSVVDPAVNIRTIRKTRYLPRFFNGDDLDRFFLSFSDAPKDVYHHTFFELMYACGMRVSELCSLTINQYNRLNGFIRINGKGSKQRLVPIAESSALLLNHYIDDIRSVYNRKNLSYIFINQLGNRLTRQYVGVVLKSKEKELDLSLKLSPHSFRHTFATDLLANDADLRVVQELLGHSDISTTQIYTHIQQNQLHKAYDQFHPGNRRGTKK